VICPHTTVLWINHDGTVKDASSGAKAWQEVPSAVHQITKEDQSNRRTWQARKMRVGQERSFDFGLQDGRLVLLNGAKPTGKCSEQIVGVLQEAYLQGKEWLNKSELRDRPRWSFAQNLGQHAQHRQPGSESAIHACAESSRLLPTCRSAEAFS
jgi:hypothetical protein